MSTSIIQKKQKKKKRMSTSATQFSEADIDIRNGNKKITKRMSTFATQINQGQKCNYWGTRERLGVQGEAP